MLVLNLFDLEGSLLLVGTTRMTKNVESVVIGEMRPLAFKFVLCLALVFQLGFEFHFT